VPHVRRPQPRRPLLSAAIVTTTALAGLAAVTAPSGAAPVVADTDAPAQVGRARAATVVGLSMRREISNQVASRAVVTVTRPGGRVAAGRLVVRSGKRVLARAVTAEGKRLRVVLELRRLGAGQHRVSASFSSQGRRLGRSNAVSVTARPGCAWRPHVCAFASAATAGVPRGTRLRPSGSVTVNRPGTVIDGLDISGTLTISASDVTVRNTRVRGSGFSVVNIGRGSTGVVIRNVEVDGLGTSGTAGSSGIVGGSPRILHTSVTGVENGFVPGSGTRIRNSYVHGLDSPGQPHYDGIQIDGGVADISVTGSTVDVSNHTQTSAVMIDNYFGPISNVAVVGNLLIGGGFTVYADGNFSDTDDIDTVTYANNRLVRGYYGYSLVRNAGVRWSGNVVDQTGSPVQLHR